MARRWAAARAAARREAATRDGVDGYSSDADDEAEDEEEGEEGEEEDESDVCDDAPLHTVGVGCRLPGLLCYVMYSIVVPRGQRGFGEAECQCV